MDDRVQLFLPLILPYLTFVPAAWFLILLQALLLSDQDVTLVPNLTTPLDPELSRLQTITPDYQNISHELKQRKGKLENIGLGGLAQSTEEEAISPHFYHDGGHQSNVDV